MPISLRTITSKTNQTSSIVREQDMVAVAKRYSVAMVFATGLKSNGENG